MTTASIPTTSLQRDAAEAPPSTDRPTLRTRFALFCRSGFVHACGRLGYAVRGVLYITVGVVAAMAAARAEGSSHPAGSRGAMMTILRQPFGQVLLAAIAAGLAGFSLWQLTRAIRCRTDAPPARRFGMRLLRLGRALFHAGLALAAVKLLRGFAGGGDDDDRARGWTAYLMSYPFGQLLVGMVGVGVFVYGCIRSRESWVADLHERVGLDAMAPRARAGLGAVCRFGIFARGVVFAMIGAFLFLASWRENPAEARGLGGALATLERQPYGPVLLAIAAGGMFAYGVYQLIRARYRRS